MSASRIALIGSETLLGADVHELLKDRLPGTAVKLAGSQDEGTAILTEAGGEAVVMTGMDEETLAEADLVILAGSAESSTKAWRLLSASGGDGKVIDLSYVLEEQPEARLRAPVAEPPSGLAAARLQVIAHPAAILVASVLRALNGIAAVERSVVTLLAPASEFGRSGVEELQRQTVQLLSFQTVLHEVFPAQLSFNLMAGTLRETEQRVERHLATLLNAATPIRLPALRVIQSPVMHCYSASVWVEFAAPVEKLGASLREEGFDIWPDDAPSVLGVAGQNGISIGAIEPDRNRRAAYWLWAVADNYRLSADNAVMLAQATLP